MRRLTSMVSEGFIWGVGITRPKPGKEQRAALYITSILALTVLVTFGMLLFLKSQLF